MGARLDGEPSDLQGWRGRILDRVLIAAAVVGAFAAASSIALSAANGLWALVVLDVAAYAVLLGATLVRTAPYTLRATVLLGVVLSVGVGVVLVVGPYGVGLTWLLAVPCLAAVLFRRRAFWISQGVVFGALGVVLALAASGRLWPGLTPPDAAWWVMAGTSLWCLSAMIGLSASTAMIGLERSLLAARDREAGLAAERAELGRVNVALRREMERRAQVEQQLVLAQKMETLGQMAGGVAHDFNNVLTVIQLEAAMACDVADDGVAVRGHLDGILEATSRASALSNRLLAFSRHKTTARTPIHVDRQIDALAPLLRRLVGERVTIEIALRAPGAHVVAEPAHLEQVLTNLVANARDAMPEGGRLRITTATAVGDDGFGIRLEVSDDGVGMDDATRLKVFEPFFTTRAKGTGLGLTTVYGVVHNLGGTISLESALGRGTRFVVWLPVQPGVAEAAPRFEAAPMPLAEGAGILVVDDQGPVRASVAAALGRLGCRVWQAGSAAEALALLDELPVLPDVVLTDVVMPGETGVDLAEHLFRRSPQIHVIAMTGHLPDSGLAQRIDDLGLPVLRKPFTPEQLLRLLGDVLAARAAG